tara:strand:- start:442 stop:693 length:252 start_codon:yes stop_codon:yes gene_type:complete
MKGINYNRSKLEEQYKEYMVDAERVAEKLLNIDFKERTERLLKREKDKFRRELEKVREAHNRGRSSILQDEMIARRRMRLKEV